MGIEQAEQTELVVRLTAQPGLRIDSPKAIHRLLRPRFLDLDREHLWRVDLDARSCLLGGELVAIGTAAMVPAHPREVFKRAINTGAWRVVLAHNHITGDLKPSPADLEAVERLGFCGIILGIDVADHLIIHNDKYLSLRESPLTKGRVTAWDLAADVRSKPSRRGRQAAKPKTSW